MRSKLARRRAGAHFLAGRRLTNLSLNAEPRHDPTSAFPSLHRAKGQATNPRVRPASNDRVTEESTLTLTKKMTTRLVRKTKMHRRPLHAPGQAGRPAIV